MPKVSEAHLRARRQQILDAAAACFARDGFHRTSMQDIVRECGVSAGLVYRYFTSKDEMIAEIVRDWHGHRRSALAARPDAMAGYLDLLREIGTGEAPDARLALQVWAETVRSDELRALAREGVQFAVAFGVEGLAGGGLAGGGLAGGGSLAGESVADEDPTGGEPAGGRLPAGVDAEAVIRVLVAVYQGLLVQTAWDDELDNEAFVRVVEELLRRLAA